MARELGKVINELQYIAAKQTPKPNKYLALRGFEEEENPIISDPQDNVDLYNYLITTPDLKEEYDVMTVQNNLYKLYVMIEDILKELLKTVNERAGVKEEKKEVEVVNPLDEPVYGQSFPELWHLIDAYKLAEGAKLILAGKPITPQQYNQLQEVLKKYFTFVPAHNKYRYTVPADAPEYARAEAEEYIRDAYVPRQLGGRNKVVLNSYISNARIQGILDRKSITEECVHLKPFVVDLKLIRVSFEPFMIKRFHGDIIYRYLVFAIEHIHYCLMLEQDEIPVGQVQCIIALITDESFTNHLMTTIKLHPRHILRVVK